MLNPSLSLLIARGTELGVPATDRVILSIGGASRADLEGVVGVRGTVSTVGVAAGVLAVEIADFDVLADEKYKVKTLAVFQNWGGVSQNQGLHTLYTQQCEPSWKRHWQN